MTDAKTVPNIILENGNANEITIYTESCEKVLSKTLVKVTPPQSTSNWSSGPKSTKIVDLLRIETRFTVRGLINSADEDKLETIFNAGGVFTFTYKTVEYNVNFEKLTITDSNKEEQDETPVYFTVLVGTNI